MYRANCLSVVFGYSLLGLVLSPLSVGLFMSRVGVENSGKRAYNHYNGLEKSCIYHGGLSH